MRIGPSFGGVRRTRGVAVLAVAAVLFTACGSAIENGAGGTDEDATVEATAAATGPDEQSTTGASAACDPDETFEIRYSHIFGPGAHLVDIAEAWQEDVSANTNGKVTFENFHGASLLGPLENMSGVGAGRAEAAQIVTAYHPTEVPLWDIGMVPGLAPNAEAQGRALNELVETNEHLQAELERINLKVLTQNPGSGGEFVIATRDQIESLEQLRNTRIRLPGGYPDQAYGLLDVDAVSISPTEAYESIQRGVVNGVYFPLDVVVATGVHEVAPNILHTGVGTTGTGGIGLNLDTWNELPECVQQVMEEAAGDDWMDEAVDLMMSAEDAACETILDAGGTASVLPEEDISQANDIISDQVVDNWRQNAIDTGLSEDVVDAYLQEYLDLYEKYAESSSYTPAGVRCAEMSQSRN